MYPLSLADGLEVAGIDELFSVGEGSASRRVRKELSAGTELFEIGLSIGPIWSSKLLDLLDIFENTIL